MTPLMGFAPDVESTTPGVLVDCAQLIPFESGMEAAPGMDVPAPGMGGATPPAPAPAPAPGMEPSKPTPGMGG